MLAITVTVPAGQLPPLDIQQLTTNAELVIHGTVTARSCQRDGAGRIFTRVELQVTEVWKGKLASNRFTIVHGGGVLGDERASVSGQADYAIGEEVVAFLVLNSRGEGVTLGLAQGKFSITTDTATGSKQAQNAFHGGGGAVRAVAHRPAPNTVSTRLALTDLRRRVQEAAR